MAGDLLQKEFLLGVDTTHVRCAYFLDRDQVLYSCGNHVLVWRQDKTQVFLHQCSSGEVIRHVQLCPNRNIISIVVSGKEGKEGDDDKEVGDQHKEEGDGNHETEIGISSRRSCSPYILFYDAVTFRRKKVSKVIMDNVHEIICVSLSRDGKVCLVLGGAPDYLLTLWSIEKATPKLLASMRLATPSGKIIQRADLCPSQQRDSNSARNLSSEGNEYLICVSGSGILRFFIVDSSNNLRPKTLKLHGEQQDYVHHCWLPNRTVVLATATHELLVISNFETKAIVFLHEWQQQQQAITTITPAPLNKGFMVGGSRGAIRFYRISQEDEDEYFLQAIREISMGGDGGGLQNENGHYQLCPRDNEQLNENNNQPQVCHIDQLEGDNLALCLLSSGRVSSFMLSNFDASNAESNSTMQGDDLIPEFHRSTNIGNLSSGYGHGTKKLKCMSICAWKPIIATGGSDRTLRIWNYQTRTFELTNNYMEDIVSVSLHPSSFQVLVCTKTQVDMSFIKHDGLHSVWHKELRTNGSSTFSRGGAYFALDMGPFVQVYNTYTCHLVSTLRGHAASIKSLCWKSDDQDLATVGADGVICVWKVWSGQRLLRYSDDKCIFIGACIDEKFKSAIINTESGVKKLNLENLSLDEKFSLPICSRVLAYTAGILIYSMANSDGVICIKYLTDGEGHSRSSNAQFCLHSGRVSLVKISLEYGKVITASDDGSLCTSQLHQRLIPRFENRYNEEIGPLVVKESLMSREELVQKDRDITKLQHRLELVKRKHEKELVDLKRAHDERIAVLDLRITEEEQQVAQKMKEENEKMSKLKEQTQTDLYKEEKRLSAMVINTQSQLDIELEVQRRKIEDLRVSCSKRCEDLEDEIVLLRDGHEKEMKILSDELNMKVKNETKRENDLLLVKEKMIVQHNCYIKDLEEQSELELINEQNVHGIAMAREQKMLIRSTKERQSMHCQNDSIFKDLEERKDTITSLEQTQLGHERHISSLKDKRSSIQTEVDKQDKLLAQVETEINTLTEDIHNMESNKIRQSKMIEDLRITLIPKEQKSLQLHRQHKDIKDDIEREIRHRKSLSLKVKQQEIKLNSMRKEHETIVSSLRIKEDELKDLETRITEAFEMKDDMHILKRLLIILSKDFFGNTRKNTSCEDYATRECESLRRQIDIIQQVISRNLKQHSDHMKRSAQETKILKNHFCEVDELVENAKRRQVQVLNQNIEIVS